MKYISKLSTSIALLSIALAFTACDSEQESAIYSDAANAAVFVSASLADITVSPADPTFTVDVVRANAGSEQSGTVALTATVEDEPLVGCTVSGYTFAAGENMAKVTVNVSPLEIGKELEVTLTLDNTNDPISGSNTVTVTVNKDYNWVSLGTGTFADILAFTEKPYNVEIRKAEGFDRYRVIKPYEQGLKNDDGQWGNAVAATSCDYIEFWIKDGIIYYNKFFIGINYDGSPSNAIYAYHPSSFSGISLANNKQLDDKTFQLAPYYYIEALQGGFDYTGEGGSILITLP
ncbi:hypothetical protein [Parabacteroides sp. AF17-28]|uniref:hypothetical protein n=1 Tax=Parabacteroides sp. AF17-28 TaxID=2292241 RepID=UPI000EFFF87B|nr:hypothetical protein [Parabacteroides sp. AF17-28]RHR60493.1 hypothetical protein DWW90_06860 [Parabacteroides sp. AF17-28]